MRTITTTEDLAAYCALAKSQPFVTIDTEFLRERTYWSKLCLIQMALPGAGEAVLIDPIEGPDMSMEPLYDLFRHEATVKVFHAARQDLVARWREWLLELTERWKGNRVVFSCRGLDYSAPLSSPRLPVPQVRLEPLTDAQIQTLVTGLGGDAALEALERLNVSRDWSLLRTPYTLRLLVEQVQAGEVDLPDWIAMQVAVLRRALRRELERGNPCLAVTDDEVGGALVSARDRRRMLQTTAWSDPYGLPEDGRLFERLGRLAWAMQAGRPGSDAGQVRIPYADAIAALDDPAADRILRAGHALGLIEDDVQRDELAFNHQLLQEHFAARRLATTSEVDLLAVPWRSVDLQPGLEETLAQLGRADPLPPAPGSGWEETALQAVMLSRDPDAFVGKLRSVDLALAGRCAARLEAMAEATERSAPGARRGRRLDADLVAGLRRALVDRSRDPSADLTGALPPAKVTHHAAVTTPTGVGQLILHSALRPTHFCAICGRQPERSRLFWMLGVDDELGVSLPGAKQFLDEAVVVDRLT
jgi:hypothetical protein